LRQKLAGEGGAEIHCETVKKVRGRPYVKGRSTTEVKWERVAGEKNREPLSYYNGRSKLIGGEHTILGRRE